MPAQKKKYGNSMEKVWEKYWKSMGNSMGKVWEKYGTGAFPILFPYFQKCYRFIINLGI